jgi:hypothetical protein
MVDSLYYTFIFSNTRISSGPMNAILVGESSPVVTVSTVRLGSLSVGAPHTTVITTVVIVFMHAITRKVRKGFYGQLKNNSPL